MVLEKTQDKQKKRGIFTAAELWKKQFDPIKWTIPGILPEGATILAGSPKVGKSWLAFSIALSVASGGKALGTIDVEQGDALYLALEDNDRRLKRRLERLWFDDQNKPTRASAFC